MSEDLTPDEADNSANSDEDIEGTETGGLDKAPPENRPGESFKRTEAACGQTDCEGTFWVDQSTLICGSCGHQVDLKQQETTIRSADSWEQFRNEEHTYRNSGKQRLPGGFPGAYEWTSSDEIDGTAGDLVGDDFYK